MPVPWNGFGGCGGPGWPPPSGGDVNVWVASTSMLVGNDTMRSTNDRVASKARARNRDLALNSLTSVVKSRVTSMTGASSLPSASIQNDMIIGLLLAA